MNNKTGTIDITTIKAMNIKKILNFDNNFPKFCINSLCLTSSSVAESNIVSNNETVTKANEQNGFFNITRQLKLKFPIEIHR